MNFIVILPRLITSLSLSLFLFMLQIMLFLFIDFNHSSFIVSLLCIRRCKENVEGIEREKHEHLVSIQSFWGQVKAHQTFPSANIFSPFFLMALALSSPYCLDLIKAFFSFDFLSYGSVLAGSEGVLWAAVRLLNAIYQPHATEHKKFIFLVFNVHTNTHTTRSGRRVTQRTCIKQACQLR